MDELFLVGAEEFVALVGAEEFVALIDDQEHNDKLPNIKEDELLLIEASRCAPSRSIGVGGG